MIVAAHHAQTLAYTHHPALHPSHDPPATLRFDYANPQHTVDQLRALQVCITGIIAGSELGVELADQLSELLGLPGNGTALTDARREKFLMGETLREYSKRLSEATGQPPIRSVKQHRTEFFDAEDTQRFLQDFFSSSASEQRMIVKPARSSGSDDVYLCTSPEEVKEKMNFILGRPNKLGIMNTCVLLQEYLEGDEYVVDTVSKDGVHKLAGCWRYLKGEANGAKFVYHGMVIVDGASETGRQVFEYTKHVLDALNIRNGCGHAEVMLSPTKGPCLVEIGARLHGGEGIFINVARRCVGYSQVEAAAAFLGTDREFETLPQVWKLKPGCFGAAIDLISYREGVLAGLSKEAVIEAMQMPAFISFNCMPKVGDSIMKTVDCFTTVGSISIALTPSRILGPDSEEASTASAAAREGIMRTIQQIRDIERRLFVLEGDDAAHDPKKCIPSVTAISLDEVRSYRASNNDGARYCDRESEPELKLADCSRPLHPTSVQSE